MGCKGITNSELMEVLVHRELAGRVHVLSKRTGFWEGGASPFNVAIHILSSLKKKKKNCVFNKINPNPSPLLVLKIETSQDDL